MRELQAVETYLRTTLGAAAAVTALVSTRLYAGLAPQRSQATDVVLPCVLWSYQAGRDQRGIGSDGRIVTAAVYQVKGIAEGESYASADAIAHAVDAAIEDAIGTVAVSGVTYRVVVQGRESPVRYIELAGGVRYYHAGGLYRILAHVA